MKVFYNCHIYNNLGDCFVVEDNKFVYVGKYSDFKYEDAELCDLNGAYVYPGFNDSHMHVVNYGKFLENISLYEHTNSLKELLSELKVVTLAETMSQLVTKLVPSALVRC